MADVDMSDDGVATPTTISQPPPTTTTEATGTNEEDDPIVATYSVFIKPALPKYQKLVVLQYVNKTGPDPSQIQQPRVLQMRVKPNTGMFEVDVPVDTNDSYDKNKGIAWGAALQKSMEAKKGGSLGLAGGFGVGSSLAPGRVGNRRGGPSAGGGGGGGANDNDDAPLTWPEACRLDKVYRTQTLSGVRSDGDIVKNMVGVFHGSMQLALSILPYRFLP